MMLGRLDENSSVNICPLLYESFFLKLNVSNSSVMSNIKVVEIWRRSRRHGYIFGLTSNTNSMLQKTWMKNYFNICMYVSRRMYRHVSQDTFMHEKTAAVLCASLNYRFADITDVSLLC